MPNFTVQKVENPSEREINASAQLFCDNMQTEKANFLAGGPPASMKSKACEIIQAKALAGEYYTATNENGEVVGYAIWTPPGHDLSSAVSVLPDEFAKTQYMVNLPQFFNSQLGPGGGKDAWWLNMVVVRADYQRHGILRAFFNAVHKKASGSTLACATNNDANVPVFLALGFTHKGTNVTPSPVGEWKTHLFSLQA